MSKRRREKQMNTFSWQHTTINQLYLGKKICHKYDYMLTIIKPTKSSVKEFIWPWIIGIFIKLFFFSDVRNIDPRVFLSSFSISSSTWGVHLIYFLFFFSPIATSWPIRTKLVKKTYIFHLKDSTTKTKNINKIESQFFSKFLTCSQLYLSLWSSSFTRWK